MGVATFRRAQQRRAAARNAALVEAMAAPPVVAVLDALAAVGVEVKPVAARDEDEDGIGRPAARRPPPMPARKQ